MDQAYLISLVEGFYPFGKRSKTGTKQQQTLVHSGDVYEQSSGAIEKAPHLATNTGVGRYLSARPIESGVSKYLKKNKAQPISGVGKYLVQQSLKGREVMRVTGVSKYLARFDSETSASGVAKYVAKQIIKTKYLPKRTSVGRYITRQEIAEAKRMALTGVAKYQAEQDLLQRKIDAQKLIERYREEEARNAAEKAAALAVQLETSENNPQPAEVQEMIATTKVGRYFQEKEKIDSQKPAVSKVAKYIAQQVVRDSLKPRQSGVAKYLAKSRVYKPKPVVSSVAKYLEAQSLLAKTKPAFSGVAKYLIRQRLSGQSLSVKASGVSKYLAQHAQTVSEIEVTAKKSVSHEFVLTGVAKYLSLQNEVAGEVLGQADVPVEICLEGEFIPAAEALENDAAKPKKAKPTRVSKYIKEHQESAKKQAVTKKPTGVEKYLLQSA
ncbi:MAG: hypothetical protein LUQ57_00150 [Methylococcaceae bacterium]|nr:hypothetical protein [Methylococcaceae bacterium]